MTYRDSIAKLGLSQGAAARFLGISIKTSNRWAAGDHVPPHVVMLLDLMLRCGISPEELADDRTPIRRP